MQLNGVGRLEDVAALTNLHGDVIVQAGSTGARVGVHASYDPFGQPIDPSTGLIGTTAADDAVPREWWRLATFLR